MHDRPTSAKRLRTTWRSVGWLALLMSLSASCRDEGQAATTAGEGARAVLSLRGRVLDARDQDLAAGPLARGITFRLLDASRVTLLAENGCVVTLHGPLTVTDALIATLAPEPCGESLDDQLTLLASIPELALSPSERTAAASHGARAMSALRGAVPKRDLSRDGRGDEEGAKREVQSADKSAKKTAPADDDNPASGAVASTGGPEFPESPPEEGQVSGRHHEPSGPSGSRPSSGDVTPPSPSPVDAPRGQVPSDGLPKTSHHTPHDQSRRVRGAGAFRARALDDVLASATLAACVSQVRGARTDSAPFVVVVEVRGRRIISVLAPTGAADTCLASLLVGRPLEVSDGFVIGTR